MICLFRCVREIFINFPPLVVGNFGFPVFSIHSTLNFLLFKKPFDYVLINTNVPGAHVRMLHELSPRDRNFIYPPMEKIAATDVVDGSCSIKGSRHVYPRDASVCVCQD